MSERSKQREGRNETATYGHPHLTSGILDLEKNYPRQQGLHLVNLDRQIHAKNGKSLYIFEFWRYFHLDYIFPHNRSN